MISHLTDLTCSPLTLWNVLVNVQLYIHCVIRSVFSWGTLYTDNDDDDDDPHSTVDRTLKNHTGRCTKRTRFLKPLVFVLTARTTVRTTFPLSFQPVSYTHLTLPTTGDV